jgi:hypothetical protein
MNRRYGTDDGLQGEGDYVADRRYRQGVRNHIATHDVDREARAAAPRSRKEARELKQAERAGLYRTR